MTTITMMNLVRYDAACRAVAEARTVDEAKDIADKAEAVRVYARQAKNRELEINAAEIRFRAERRIGELKIELREAGRLQERGRPENSASEADFSKVKLADLGVDEHLSRRSERLASIEPNAFDRLVGRWRAHQEATSARVSVSLLKEDETAKRRAAHAERREAGGKVADLHALIASGWRAGAILADPPWHFMARSEKGEGRSASQHYRTEAIAGIAKLPVAALAAPDCVLFLWMLDWCPFDALALIDAWGFAHKTTAFTWVKENSSGEAGFFMGQGYWTRANPEQCWLATKGNPRRLYADVRQLVIAPVMEHSRKPDEIHARIERLCTGPYLELYARRERPGWLTWGEELGFVAPEPAPLPPHDPETGEIAEISLGEGLDIPPILDRRVA